MTEDATTPICYRPDQVPSVFPIKKTTLYLKMKTGEIDSFTVGRARLIPRQALVDFMKKLIDEQNAGSPE